MIGAPSPPTEPAPRYLRFMTALVLGSALVAVPALAGCGDNRQPPTIDAGLIDARIIDAFEEVVVDGPLQPPDLPRLA